MAGNILPGKYEFDNQIETKLDMEMSKFISQLKKKGLNSKQINEEFIKKYPQYKSMPKWLYHLHFNNIEQIKKQYNIYYKQKNKVFSNGTRNKLASNNLKKLKLAILLYIKFSSAIEVHKYYTKKNKDPKFYFDLYYAIDKILKVKKMEKKWKNKKTIEILKDIYRQAKEQKY